MIDVEETERGVRAVDAAKNEVEVELKGWEPGGDALKIDRRTHATFSGYVKEVRLPGRAAFIETAGRTQHRIVKYDERHAVEDDEHLVQTDDVVTTFLRTDDAFGIRCDIGTGWVDVTFDRVTLVTIGFRSHADYPSERVRVPPTPEGLSVALSSLGTSHHTETPDRSYPSMRGHPPAIEIGPEADAAIDRSDDSESSVRLLLPPSLEYAFYSASLAYYLGASVEVGDVANPVLRFEDQEYVLPRSVGDFSRRVANLLSRVFYLDCLVRNVGPYGFDIAELDLLDEVSIEADEVYPLPLADRLVEYVGVDFERISRRLPRWPLSVSIGAQPENVPALSRLSYCLALLFPPESNTVDEGTAVERSLSDFCRSVSSNSQHGTTRYSNIVDPVNRVGTLHGWFADGIPLDAFKGVPSAFTSRGGPPTDPSPRTVAVVLNDGEMGAEFAEVVSAYRERGGVCSIDVDLSSRLTMSELATIFRSPYDVVHYIGHCEPQGLRCEDGNFSVDSVSETRVNSVFLNACESYDQGLSFIRKGGNSCAVTIGDVLDEQAQKVGTTFAQLLGRGFGFGFALVLARCRAIMNRQYAIIGDGTNVLSQGETSLPTALYISESRPDAYRVRPYLCSPTFHGSIRYEFPESNPVLAGNDGHQLLSRDELRQKLSSTDHPILFEDEFYWPGELLQELS